MDSSEDRARVFCKLMDRLGAIRASGSWGRRQHAESILTHLQSEVDELCDAVERKDLVLIQEESGDVFMLACLCVLIVAEDFDMDVPGILRAVIQKLERRYPQLFLVEQLKFEVYPADPQEESEIYARQKAKDERLKFCFCGNEACPQHAEAGSPSLQIVRKDGREFVRCTACSSQSPISHASILNGVHTAKTEILRIMAELFSSANVNDVARRYGVRRRQIERWLSKAAVDSEVIARIMNERFNLDEQQVLAHLKNKA